MHITAVCIFEKNKKNEETSALMQHFERINDLQYISFLEIFLLPSFCNAYKVFEFAENDTKPDEMQSTPFSFHFHFNTLSSCLSLFAIRMATQMITQND